ncbi:MAG: hypothetical protein A3K67_02310 [Euryarchaeota archaeon RBG_16_62_10]|nr:MAG: hypothetical protein A3K67_02310 [Euryarchaeota archaeon RBG_16_62_10]
MIEVESKFWSPGNERVEKALVALGAKRLSQCDMEDVYFSHPARDFGKTDEALRLRKMEGLSELTYKGPRMKVQDVKAREEITLKSPDPVDVQRIVERLGFKELHVVRKKRTSYLLDKLKVEVDEVEGLGEFVELEALTESPERAAQLMELARKELGLDRPEQKTYLEMLLERRPRDRPSR